MEETIVAISTPPGESGIGIVRLSGSQALDIASKIFIRARGGSLPLKPYRVYYGYIVNPQNSQLIEEIILTYMRAPRSYTGEDIVELNCHGGLTPTRRILELCLDLGARLAEPGEFTKRAFLNGRIDLTQAEAVIDIIKSRSERSLNMAMRQLKGDLSRRIGEIRYKLLDVLALVEASLDFPDEELEINEAHINAQLAETMEEMDELILSFREGKIIREGLAIPIVGRTNVGKSSLMNRLLQYERAIVSPLPGTTRDTINEDIVIRGVPMKMIDTAGLRECVGSVENEGIKRTRAAIEQADIILFMFDASEGMGEEDELIAEEIKGHRVIAVANKVDLLPKHYLISGAPFQSRFEEVKISAKEGIGIEDLKEKMAKSATDVGLGDGEGIIVSRARHVQALKMAKEAVESAHLARIKGFSAEFGAIDLREALEQLSRITGQSYTEEVLERIFNQFCIGK